MAENLYEGMFVLDSGKFAADPERTAGNVLQILEKAGATVVAHRPWQDGRLAYSMDGHRKALHYLCYFQMNGEGVREIARACRLSDVVVRHLIIKHPKVLFDVMVEALSGVEIGARTEGDKASRRSDDSDDDDEDEDEDE